MSDAKVLFKNGEWLVPPEERPPGWEKLPTRSAASDGSAPLLAAIAVATITIAQERLDELTSAEPELCECGKPRAHREMCKVRARKAAQTRASRLSAFRELDRAIAESAEDFSAEKGLRMAARVMVAGIWTRDIDKLRVMTGYGARYVREVADRLSASRIWREPDCVWLGENESDTGDFAFWLNAMVAEGTLYTDDGEVYGLPGWRQSNEQPTGGSR